MNRLIPCLLLLLAVIFTACAPEGEKVVTRSPVPVASQQPAATPTASMAPSATPSTVPSATPMLLHSEGLTVEIVGYGGNGVIDAPSAGIDLAKYIATGETSALLERLRLTRFEKSDGASA